MKAITKSTRITQAATALRFMTEGLTQMDACAKAGISPGQLRRWLSEEDTYLEQIRAFVMQTEQSNLALVSSARAHIVDRLCEAAMDPELSIRQLIAIDKHLSQVERESEQRLDLVSPAVSDEELEVQNISISAQHLLQNGPVTHRPDSVFTARITQAVVELTRDGVFEEEDPQDGDIIDG